jgi:hypothetical protein
MTKRVSADVVFCQRSGQGIVDAIKNFAADLQIPLTKVTVEIERDGRDGTVMLFLGRSE